MMDVMKYFCNPGVMEAEGELMNWETEIEKGMGGGDM